MSTAATPKAAPGPKGASPGDCSEVDTRAAHWPGKSNETEA
jgi:hypothetical protein